jgi:DNA-binding CsgD family transcriptional regulator/tetratricopeptide (TPR) repeat protein
LSEAPSRYADLTGRYLQCAAKRVAADARSSAPEQVVTEWVGGNRPGRRPPFVGREAELRQLQSAFEAAARGDGALVLLAGEPGIGKTALCEQLARFVAEQGGRVLVGHSYAEGSVGVAYQPFVEAFERYSRERTTDTLRSELGKGASAMARMVPAVQRLLQLELHAPADPADDRLSLMSGVLECLRGIGKLHPLLLVLEDLHDADRGTLDLVVYLARHLVGARMLVVGTYRDVEVDRAHPLAATLAELRRGGHFERVHVGQLSIDEVQRLLASTSQQAVPRPLAEEVHRRTGGNALFTHELLRVLLAEGLVEPRDGMLRRVGEAALAGRMPEGLRDVVGKRLSSLSPAANQVLSVASVIGREFQLDVLQRLLPWRQDELESALEEALGSGLVEERSVVGASITYRFSHAFFQQTLYDEILAPRRIRLHQQIARVVEEVHARRLDEHAAELAEHYAFSSDAHDLAKAVSYAELAARRAGEVFAYGEAARQLERALVVQDLVDPEDQAKRCDLLLALGEALLPTGETDRVISRIMPDALSVAEGLNDRRRAFRACQLGLECLWVRGAGSDATRPEYLAWAEKARDYAEVGTVESVRANLALANAWFSRDRFREARAVRRASMELARRLDDRETLFRSALPTQMNAATAPQAWGELARMADEVTGWPREGVSNQVLGQVLEVAGRIQLAQGARARAEELWWQVQALAERTHLATVNLLLSRRDIILEIIDGHLEEALASLRRFVERADESGAALSSRQFTLSMLQAPALYLGRAEAWLAAFDEFAELAGPVTQAVGFSDARAVCLAHLGRFDQARGLVGTHLERIEGSRATCGHWYRATPGPAGGGNARWRRSTDEDETPMYVLVWLLEAAVLLGEQRAVRALSQRLACVAHLSIGEGLYTCPPRHLGDAAVLLGDRTAARAYYALALEAAGKIRFRPELALTHLRLADLLPEDENDAARSEARAHLDVAIPELQDMHMQPALEQALALRNNCAASVEHMSIRSPGSETLTAREREIASLMADGLSNREIADRLVISEGTVEVHVKHILSKLGYRSRTQVAARFANQQADGPSDGRS